MSMTWGAQGRVLAGRYRLIAKAGTGGMAVVWRASDLVLGRDVAIKLLSAEDSPEADVTQRLKSEAQAIARLKHPHITGVHDFGEHIGPDGAIYPFVVMEFVEGTTLSQRLADGTPMPWPEATRVAAEVASALAYAHSRGIAHRDISCTNIMLTDDGAKVLDFGIAAMLGQPDGHPDDEVLGTPAYVAPERLRGPESAVTATADVYALGVVWYHMLAGRMPWQARSGTGLIQAHLVYAPAPLPPIDSMPASLATLCLRCLAKNPQERPTSDQLADGLAEFVRPPRPPTRTTQLASGGAWRPRLTKRAKRLALAGAVAGAIAVAGAVAPGWLRSTADQGLAPGAAPAAVSPTASATGATSAWPSPAAIGPGEPAIVTPTVGDPSAVPPIDSPATSAAPAPPAGFEIAAWGGRVRVSCDETTASVLDVSLVSGYTIKDYDPGPAEEVQVVLISQAHESEIKVKCAAGAPRPRVKETPQ